MARAQTVIAALEAATKPRMPKKRHPAVGKLLAVYSKWYGGKEVVIELEGQFGPLIETEWTFDKPIRQHVFRLAAERLNFMSDEDDPREYRYLGMDSNGILTARTSLDRQGLVLSVTFEHRLLPTSR